MFDLRFIFGSLFAVSVGLTSPALAAVESSGSVSGVRFTLVDLDPSDGITPSFSLLTDAGETGYTLYLSDPVSGSVEDFSFTTPGTLSLSDQMVGRTLSNANGMVSVNGSSMAASGSAAGGQTSYTLSAETGSPSWNQTNNISLSAGSALIIDVDYMLAASASSPLAAACVQGEACAYEEFAQAQLNVELFYTYQTEKALVSHSERFQDDMFVSTAGPRVDQSVVYNPDTGGYDIVDTPVPAVTADSKSTSSTFRTVFTNASNLSQGASFWIGLYAGGAAGSAPAVPEPASMAMMGLGLLALAGRQVRRGTKRV